MRVDRVMWRLRQCGVSESWYSTGLSATITVHLHSEMAGTSEDRVSGVVEVGQLWSAVNTSTTSLIVSLCM